MKPLLKGDLKTLYGQKAIKVHRNGAIEYVRAFTYRTPSHPEDTYQIYCVGKNPHGVCYTGASMECLKGNFFFQVDTRDTYDRVKDNPELLYETIKAA